MHRPTPRESGARPRCQVVAHRQDLHASDRTAKLTAEVSAIAREEASTARVYRPQKNRHVLRWQPDIPGQLGVFRGFADDLDHLGKPMEARALVGLFEVPLSLGDRVGRSYERHVVERP